MGAGGVCHDQPTTRSREVRSLRSQWRGNCVSPRRILASSARAFRFLGQAADLLATPMAGRLYPKLGDQSRPSLDSFEILWTPATDQVGQEPISEGDPSSQQKKTRRRMNDVYYDKGGLKPAPAASLILREAWRAFGRSSGIPLPPRPLALGRLSSSDGRDSNFFELPSLGFPVPAAETERKGG